MSLLIKPDVIATIRMYPRNEEGAVKTKRNGWRAPCFSQKSVDVGGYTGHFIVDGEGLTAGMRKNVGIKFLNKANALKEFSVSGIFYIWEGRFLAEAEIIEYISV